MLLSLSSSKYKFPNNVHMVTYSRPDEYAISKGHKHILHWMELFALGDLDCFVIVKCALVIRQGAVQKPFEKSRV